MTHPPLRILAVADVWHGSNANAYVQAFRRLGHSVRVLPVDGFVASEWRRSSLRLLRRLLNPVLVDEYNSALLDASREHEPDLLFVYKGRHVREQTIRAVRSRGAIAVNVYPDNSLLAHGPHIPRALPAYDWVFHTKKFGIDDLARLDVRQTSVLPHGFDPDVHCAQELTEHDRTRYACDVSFVGTWSPKKQALLEHVHRALPDLRLRIWGEQWGSARATLNTCVEGRGVHGREYAKALIASRINLGILSEARRGASSGDQITSRTFHIPATGAFMLHERTAEFGECFEEGVHCAAFSGAAELVRQIQSCLADDSQRRAMAAAGRRHAIERHSVDARALVLLDRVRQLQATVIA